MNSQLANTTPPAQRRPPRVGAPRSSDGISLRPAHSRDAAALHALIETHAEEGHLLPRHLDELTLHASRFVVAIRRGRVVGCAELAPLSGVVAEVRSLAVDPRARARGIGRQLVDELQKQARLAGFETLCAFAHDAGFFVRLGFSLVPHTWVPEKIARDCVSCTHFRRCAQHALVLPLTNPNGTRVKTFVPLASLRA